MRRILIFLVIVVLFLGLLVGLLAVVVHTDWFWKKALPQYLNQTQNDFIIKNVDYDKKSLGIAGEISFENLKFTVQNDQPHVFNLRKFHFKNIWALFHPEGGKLLVAITGLSMDSTDIEAKNCQFHLGMAISGLRLTALDGDVSCQELLFAKNPVSDFRAKIQGKADWFALEDIVMNYRQGTVTGRATFGLNDVLPYVLDLKFHDLILDQDVFDGNILGRISGTFQANGFAERLSGFEVVLDAPQGAKIRAELLQSIVPYLPAKSSVKKDLDAIIQIGGYVYFEVTHAVIKRMDGNKAVATVSLKTKKLNLVLNPTIDINIEGGLQSIFNVIEFFSNPGG